MSGQWQGYCHWNTNHAASVTYGEAANTRAVCGSSPSQAGARPVLCPCPAGCQDALDTLYDTCGGTCSLDGTEWDTNIRTTSDQINAAGCSSAEMVRHDPYVPS